jgi:REP element-mobilizing transposase RayT
MATARYTIVPPGSSGYYHCVSRCVRKSFLCGFDRSTGQNFDHRRGWIVERMNELAQIYAVRVLAFSAMSNHMHLALHFDPSWVEAWTDQEVAERWNRLFPKAKMTEQQQAVRIQAWLAQEGKIANMRERLASVSEFMKYLSQPIALRANIEDDCKGKFWESRFKCQRLLDEAAVLSAMVYVDLNPVRAAMAQDLEDSDYTSIQQRIRETALKLGREKHWTHRFSRAAGEDRRVCVFADVNLEVLAACGGAEAGFGRFSSARPGFLPIPATPARQPTGWGAFEGFPDQSARLRSHLAKLARNAKPLKPALTNPRGVVDDGFGRTDDTVEVALRRFDLRGPAAFGQAEAVEDSWSFRVDLPALAGMHLAAGPVDRVEVLGDADGQ